MRKTQTFIITVDNEEKARQKAMDWYSRKENLTVDTVKSSPHGGYQVAISYDEENNSE